MCDPRTDPNCLTPDGVTDPNTGTVRCDPNLAGSCLDIDCCPEGFEFNEQVGEYGKCEYTGQACYIEFSDSSLAPEPKCRARWVQPPSFYSPGESAYWDDAFNDNLEDCFSNDGGIEIQSCCYSFEYDETLYGGFQGVDIGYVSPDFTLPGYDDTESTD